MSRYFEETPTYVNLGSGTTFGNGYTDRNVNLGAVSNAFSPPAYYPSSPYVTENWGSGYGGGGYYKPQPQTVANPEYDKNNPYGLEDNQVVMNEGKPNAMIVGKDAPRGWWGIPRAIFGGIDAVTNKTWLPDTDLDKRGTGRDSYGNLPKPGELGAAPVLVPKTIANPQLPQMVPNAPYQGGPVPSNWKSQLGYYGTNAAIGQVGTMLGDRQLNKRLDDVYNRELKALQDADAQGVLTSIAMQNTPKGKQEIASRRQEQMSQSALANYYRRLGVAAMSKESAAKAIGGLVRNQYGAGGAVSSLGNWGA